MQGSGTFQRVHPAYDIRLIRSRLGYRPDATQVDESVLRALEGEVERISRRFPVTVVWQVERVARVGPDSVLLECGMCLMGSRFSEWMTGSDELLLMLATMGNALQEEISTATQAGRLSDAVVIDAAASEIVDAGLDWLMQFAGRELMREARVLTPRRYSPGYGDMPLEEQRKLAELLRIGEHGVKLTETCILSPEKSVMAIAGILSGR